MHSFKKGNKIWVINCKMSGTFFVEGRATIRSLVDDMEEQYIVHFDGDRTLGHPECERFVDPAAQDDPGHFVAELNSRN